MSDLQNLPAGVEIQLRAVEPRSDAHHPQLPKATSCPKGKDLHFLLRRNTCINVISITHEAVVQQRSHLTASFGVGHILPYTCALTLAHLIAAVESSEALRSRKQTQLLMCRYAKPVFAM